MIFSFVLIGRCDYFGFGFTTLNRKALYSRQLKTGGNDATVKIAGYAGKCGNSVRTSLDAMRSRQILFSSDWERFRAAVRESERKL